MKRGVRRDMVYLLFVIGLNSGLDRSSMRRIYAYGMPMFCRTIPRARPGVLRSSGVMRRSDDLPPGRTNLA